MLDKLFSLSERKTTVRTEILAGITTFITMAYILFVAPGVLSAAGMDPNAVFIATCLGGGLVTIAMGVFVNYPICLAPGVGLLAFYAFTVCIVCRCRGRPRWELFLFPAWCSSSSR